MALQRSMLFLCILFDIVSAGPCDIYAATGTPCAAAHSLVRALYSAYTGRLYQLKRFHDNATLDITVLGPGGLADSVSHDKFCASQRDDTGTYPSRADCVVWQIYDQTGNGNHMLPGTPSYNNPHFYAKPVHAMRHPIMVAGHKVYGAYFEGHMGYRAQNTTRVARGNDPETIYMVTSGTHINSKCCFDYGNSEIDCTNHSSYHDGAMEAVYFGTGYGGASKGPWIGVDMENGIYGGNYTNDSFLHSEFVTAMIKGGSDSFAVKGGDATAGNLKVMWDGPRPQPGQRPSYRIMQKQGGIILGMGGDGVVRMNDILHSSHPEVGTPESIGTFYEGLLTVGYTSDAADAAVQADIVNAGYGRSFSGRQSMLV